MIDTVKDSTPIPGMEAVHSTSGYSPNDDARNQTANQDPYRYCVNTSPIASNPDSMKGESSY